MKIRGMGRTVSLVIGVGVAVLLSTMGMLFKREIRGWYLLVTQFERLPDNAKGYAEYKHELTGIVFVRLPRGTFLMGSPESEQGRFPFEPKREVSVGPFLIAKFEVTKETWKRPMGDHPIPWSPSQFPVDAVSWETCQEFCRKTGLSFPTEAQWEYACRAGTTGPYSGTGRLEDMGWYNENTSAPQNTHVVGEKEPNGFGLYDMHGNVSEWCEDVLDPALDNYLKAKGWRSATDSRLDARVIRGGNADQDAVFCRSAFRAWGVAAQRVAPVGFRPAFNLQ